MRAKGLGDSWFVIQPTERLHRKAVEIVEAYDLRAADALQLAAAVEWSENRPQGRTFLTSDHKLGEAARFIGFDVKQI